MLSEVYSLLESTEKGVAVASCSVRVSRLVSDYWLALQQGRGDCETLGILRSKVGWVERDTSGAGVFSVLSRLRVFELG